MAIRRVFQSQRGAVSWTVVGIISIVVIILGLAVAQLGDAETMQSVIHRSKNDVYFVADSGRRISEQGFQRFMLGAVKQNMGTSVTTSDFDAAVAAGDPVLFLEKCTGILRKEPGHAQYRVDLSGGTTNLVNDTGTPIENKINADDDRRTFDTLIDVWTGDVPVSNSNYWAFPLRFRIAVRAKAPTTKGRSARASITGRGTVTLYVNKRSFANYLEYSAGYMSLHGEPDMKGRDSYQGPVHTSGKFRFMDCPGTYFQNEVTTTASSALFFNGTSYEDKAQEFLMAKGNKSYLTKPQFNGGFFFNVVVPSLPASYDYFRKKTLGLMLKDGIPTTIIKTPTDTTSAVNNIYTSADSSTNVMRVAGVLVVGPCGIDLQDVGGNQLYTFTHYDGTGAVLGTSTITVDYANNQTIIQRRGETAPQAYTGVLDADSVSNGPQTIFYVSGPINSLRGTLANNTQLTIEATGPSTAGNPGITITGDLTYASPPADGAATSPSILGLVSETGDIMIKYPVAPTNITIHAHLMAPDGEIWCEHRNDPMKGSVNLFGSVASKRAGVMGSRSTGYAKKYVWDTRATFAPPPYYPAQSKYGVIFEKPETGKSTWRVTWASEDL